MTADQLVSGVGLPLTDSGDSTASVFLLLNSESTPMFSLLQTWRQSVDKSGPFLAAEYAEGVPSLSSQTSAVRRPNAGDIVADAWTLQQPVVAQNGNAATRVIHSRHVASPTFGVAIPTIENGETTAVTVLAN